MSKPLFDEESVSDEEFDFGTNKEYAKQYNKFRQKELLKKLKDKEGGGGTDDSDSSSDSDSSDDDETVFNPKFDAKFYETLASLKTKDPKIYDKEVNFFGEIVVDTKASGDGISKKQKALTVKEYEQKILVEKGGIYEDEEDENGVERPQSLSYRDEQAQIKNEFQKVLQEDSDEDDGDNWGGIFKKREKTSEDQKKEDAEQKKWLAENADVEKAKAVQDVWANRKLTKDDIFLRDYILTDGYANRDEDEIPTYDEIVGDTDNEDDFDVKQAEFEHKYNFRFEEPDQEFIKRYPRTIENSVRKTDDRRKQKRVEVRERKEREKQEKFQEVEMLKELKRKEIEEKIEKLKAVTGHENLNTDLMDLDGDFDPDEYDKKMQDIFNSEYYGVDEGEDKPECPSDIEDLKVENYDEYEPGQNAGAHCEDDDFNMDCEYDGAGPSSQSRQQSLQQELIESTRDKRKRRKRKSKFMEMLESKKPAFNPDDAKSYGEYLDEYYQLDCEDIIGDVKCRFKYVETAPNDFGLTVEEILLAKNKELNAWASLKKATQVRPDHIERKEQAIFQRKARNDALKKKILASLYEEPSDDEPEISTNVSKTVVFNSEPEESANKTVTKKPEVEKKPKNKKSIKSATTTQSTPKESTEAAPTPIAPQETVKIVTHNPIIEPAREKITEKEVVTDANSAEVPTPDTTHIQKKKPELKPKAKQIKPLPSVGETKPKPKVKPIKPLPTGGETKSKPNVKSIKPLPTGGEIRPKPKPMPKVKLIKPTPTADPSKFGKIKFDKNFAKKAQPNAKIVKSNGLTDERLKAFGINPRRYNWKLKHASGNETNQKSNANNNKRPNSNKKSAPSKSPSAPLSKKFKVA